MAELPPLDTSAIPSASPSASPSDSVVGGSVPTRQGHRFGIGQLSPLNTSTSAPSTHTAPLSPRLAGIMLSGTSEQKTDPSQTEHREYKSVAEYVTAMGGKRAITKILIANNGIAAVKAIRSIKRWAYETFGNEKMISFVAMATPEDLKANAEYIHLADEFITVPGGSNNHNYANVMLITDIAERTGAHAVWAGWGHASENPKLPESLAKTKNNVVWIGPPPSAMRALGDKIGSTLIAQSAGVPCVPWNGTGIQVDYAKSGLPADVYQRACVRSKEEAVEAAERIGYPVMIKASEGGGGKGIRKVEKREQIELAFGQVQGEVPGSPIFIMKLCPVARHLEVQLLADEWGDAIAVSGRDCSIQRRHQKIIEEGPVVAAPKEIWKHMERAAVRLAKEVGYVGAGTVEYLFTPTNEYFFLELNPRLQVEHPVTELITGVNLPAAQLQVAMGIPLHRLPGVRRLYGRNRTGDNRIDFDNEETRLLPGHVIACRITAENPDMAFQPTSGQIQELNFRSTPDVWGYFSVGSYGGVHEYSDSQFGHLFALGETREMARRNMVVALKELSIRGDMRTTVEFLPKILETEDYRKGNVSTTWLEKVMAQHTVQAEKPSAHLVVILGALFRAFTQSTAHMTEYTQTLDRGQMPSQALHNSLVEMQLDLIYDKIKYEFTVTRSAPNSFDMTVGSSKRVISADVHTLADGGLLVLLDGKKHVVYGQEFPSGLRLTVDGKTCLFSVEYDPTQLRSSMAGKLVRFLVPDGTHLEKNQPYAEMEVMKMYVTLMAPERGTLRIVKPEGSVMESGDLIAALDVDDPDTVEKADLFQGEFPPVGPPIHIGDKPNLLLMDALKKLENMLSGYKLGLGVGDEALNMLMKCLRNPRLPLLQFEVVFSALAGRVPESLYDAFQSIAREYANSFTNDRFYWESPEPFPVVEIQSAIDTALMQQGREDEQTKLRKNIAPVLELLDRYRGGNHTYAVYILQTLLRQFFEVESHFNNSKQPESVIKLLRRQFKDDTQAVVNIALAHNQVPSRAGLITTLLSIVETQLAPLLGDFVPVLKHLSTLNGKPYSAVALKARQLLIRHELPSSEQRRIAIQTILQSAVQTLAPEERLSRLSLLIHQSQPIADALLSFLDSGNNAMKAAAMEVYVRRVYQVYTIVSMQIDFDAKSDLLKARWEFFMDLEKLEAEIQSEQDDDSKEEGATRPATGAAGQEAEEEASLRAKKLNRSLLGMRAVDSVSNLQSLNKDMGPPVLNRMPSGGKQTTPTAAASTDASKSKKGTKVAPLSEKALSVAVKSEEISRVGVMAYCKTFESLKKNFETILQDFPLSVPSPSSSSGGQSPASTGSGRQPTSARGGKEPVHVLYVSCKWGSRIASDDQLTAYFGAFLKTFSKSLHTRGIRRVTFIVAHSGDEYPSYFTFRHRLDYGEDTIIRHIEPSNALHLELTRLSNFKLRFVPTTNRMIHMFAAFPLNSDNPAGQAKKKGDDEAYDGRRMFARVIVRRVDSAFLNNGESPLPPNTPSSSASGQESTGSASGSGSFFSHTTVISPGFGTATAGSMGAAPAEAMVSPSSTPSPDLLSAMKGTGARTGLLKPVDLDAYPETEIAFVEALNALEMAMGSESRKWRNGSIFINVLVEAFIDPRYVEAVIRMLARRYSDKIQRSHINIVEFQLQMKLDPNVNTFTPVRFVATNPTNADLRVHVYTHKRDPQTGRTVFASMNPYDKGDLDGKEITAPYSVTRPFDKPRQLAELLGTTYCYDWPALVEKALSQVWRHFRKAVHQSPIAQQFIAEALKLAHQNTSAGDKSFAPGGEKFDVQVHIVNALKKLAPHLAEDQSCVSLLALLAPKMPTANTLPAPVTVNPSFSAAVKTAAPNQSFDWYHTSLAPRESFSDSVELILVPANSPEAQAAGGEAGPMPQRDGFKLVESKRPMGQNTVGMVAWRINMRTPTHPSGRSIVVISNDITFQAGTFGVQEDLLFQLASEYARQRKLPRIYIAANSGARIGLADEVRSKIRVAWAGNDPMKGFQYMYLSEADYNELKDCVVCTRQVVKGEDTGGSHNEEVRYVINDIIGRRSGLGVENLRGSGMIAGETSLAYDEIFTLTYVTGRTVGIGSYLARLGQRCIQKKDSSIILTGFSALNKLLGRPVYNSNVQLGGVDIMYTNGVSHLTVEHDLEGVHHILNWLSFVPARRLEAPAILPLPASFVDPIERPVSWRPPKEPYDPHFLIDGVLDDGGQWTGGFFDKGSFTELLGGWARTVICGRARLGGIPMGVIAVETRTIEDNIPADPAVPESKEQNVVRAGQVWYPDSAYKTAQAIKDMAAEDLPIMIFANWRGFSGGMQDMLREVLKFGSYIVDNLRTHNQPIFVYLPPNANLRGGAWVVVDETINERMMEMYADEDSRGGVLEPEGTVDVKFRREDLLQLMHRLDAQLGKWDKELEKERAEAAKADKHAHAPAVAQTASPQSQLSIVVNATGSRPAPADKPADGGESKVAASEKEKELLGLIKKRETALLPLYHQAATNFADLHDTPGRMKAKGVIRAVVKWKTSRAFFYWRLRRRLFEYEYGKKIQALQLKAAKKAADVESWRAALATFKAWVAKDMGQDNTNNMWENDVMLLQWMESHRSFLDGELRALEINAIQNEVSQLAVSDPAAFAQGIVAALASLSGPDQQKLKASLRGLLKL